MTNRKYYKIYALAIAISIFPFLVEAQNTRKPNWQNLDQKTDTTFGISTERAYTELLKGKKSQPVIVAVIDGGVDIDHEDLKTVIWTNPKEKPGNQKDDDNNGYADDIHGWDFIGGAKGDINYENLELTRVLRKLKPKFDNVTSASAVNPADMADYNIYLKAKADYSSQLEPAKKTLALYSGIKTTLDSLLATAPKGQSALDFFQAFTPASAMQARVKSIMLRNLKVDPDVAKFEKEALDPGIDHFKEVVDYQLNFDFHPRDIVGDDPNNSNEHAYGNNDVNGPDAHHGSHVAGIIAAVRDNNIGIKGIADNAVIISVRTVPNGDERDKDVANAIRYAATNGAKVINMSFGKAYSWDKKVVDDAVKFAISKDVLLIHAAGNDNKNLDVDSNTNYPNRIYADKSGIATNWIEVGASDYKDDSSLKATFSNYGKTSVDVFAPGVNIKSTVPGNSYAEYSGTSMACPVVVGLATLIRSYYPKLKAAEVKEIILKSVTPVTHNVTLDDGKSKKDVPFTELCATGGIVNAYNALKLAATY